MKVAINLMQWVVKSWEETDKFKNKNTNKSEENRNYSMNASFKNLIQVFSDFFDFISQYF